MKNALLTLCLLLLPSFAFAGDKKVPNLADYPIVVHVVASYHGSKYHGSMANPIDYQPQVLDAVIDGKAVQLESRIPSLAPLALGDYKAKLTKSYGPANPPAYDIYIIYEFLFPDGKTRDFVLTGFRGTSDTPSHPE